MRPAPCPNIDETTEPEDKAVADPLSDETLKLWNDTAKNNREIFTEVFRPVPTNEVKDWNAYAVRVPIAYPSLLANGRSHLIRNTYRR